MLMVMADAAPRISKCDDTSHTELFPIPFRHLAIIAAAVAVAAAHLQLKRGIRGITDVCIMGALPPLPRTVIIDYYDSCKSKRNGPGSLRRLTADTNNLLILFTQLYSDADVLRKVVVIKSDKYDWCVYAIAAED